MIRTSHPGDAGWVISMHGLVYSREFRFDPEFEIDIAAKMVEFFKKKDPLNTLLICEVNTRRAGSLAVSRLDDNTAFLNFLLVLPEFREQGIARALLEKAVDHTRAHGLTTLRLETYSCLKKARYFYKDYGFSTVGSPVTIKKFGREFAQEFWSIEL